VGDADYVNDFIQDLAARPANRVQLTTKWPSLHLAAVESASGSAIDEAVLVKQYCRGSHGDQRTPPRIRFHQCREAP
jgi:hypothetical protein